MAKTKTRVLETINEEKFNEAIDAYFLWKKLDDKLRVLSGKRGINLPSEITEIIVAYCFNYKICREGSGDIIDDSGKAEKIIEVKGASSTGPNSFSPSEVYDNLIFIHLEDKKKDIFKIYDTGFSSKDIDKVKVNKTQTLAQQRAQGRRPRFVIKDQLIDEYKIPYTYEIDMHSRTIAKNDKTDN